MRGCLKRNDCHLKFSTHSAKTPYSLFLPHSNNNFLLVQTWLWVLLQSLGIVSSRLVHVRMCGRICFTYGYSIGVIMGLATGLCLLATADNAAVNVCANACVSPCSQVSQASTQRQNHCPYGYSLFRGTAGFYCIRSHSWVLNMSFHCLCLVFFSRRRKRDRCSFGQSKRANYRERTCPSM